MFEPILSYALQDLSHIEYLIKYSDVYINAGITETDDTHIHDCLEIYLNISGDISFLVGNSIFKISPGDIVISAPRVIHRCIYNSSCVHQHYCLWLSEDKSTDILNFLNDSGIAYLGNDCGYDLNSRFSNLNFAVCMGDSLEASAELLGILSVLKKRLVQSTSANLSRIPERLQDILNYVNRNYNEFGSVSELTKIFFVSTATLNRWFVRYLNMSPKLYLRSVRLSNAKRMLGEGKTVTATCLGCGYSDCSHFISVFKKEFGETPLQYRNRNL